MPAVLKTEGNVVVDYHKNYMLYLDRSYIDDTTEIKGIPVD